MYKIGDKIVHPMHGAGVIADIVSKTIDGVERSYYSLSLPVGGMVVLIPTDHTHDIGMRPVMACTEADEVLNGFGEIEVDETTNWNKRYRDNMLRLKSGDLIEVGRVLKALMLRDGEKGLSAGERKMLNSARQIFYSEIVLSQDCSYEEVDARISAALV